MDSKITTYDVVFVSPPSRMINHYRPPVGLLYIGGYLQKKRLNVKIIDVPMKNVVRNKVFYQNIDEELKKIERQMIDEFKGVKTKAVGIAFFTPEYFEVFETRVFPSRFRISFVTGSTHGIILTGGFNH